MAESIVKSEALMQAEKAFKKPQLMASTPAATAQYRERQRATLENMSRLRAQRLATQVNGQRLKPAR